VSDPAYCGGCYGGDPADGAPCCNTCHDVQEAYSRKGWAINKFEDIEQVRSDCMISPDEPKVRQGGMDGQVEF
jgi:hypothetical protein